MLISNGSIVVQGTGTNVQGLDITVKFPSGLYRITGDGNDVPLKVIYRLRYRRTTRTLGHRRSSPTTHRPLPPRTATVRRPGPSGL